MHIEKDPLIVLTPVFKDYDKHLEDIEKLYGASEKGTNKVAQVPPKNTICTHQQVCGRSTRSGRAPTSNTPREQVPPAPPAPRQANPAHTETQDNPKNDEHVRAFLTHYRKPPLTVESLVTCAAMSRRKVVRAVMQRRFASPNEAGACSITPTSPRTPPCCLHVHIPPVRPPHSHSPTGRVPASSGEWFRPLPALGQLQITEPSHKPTMHRQQPRSQTNPSARGDRHHHQMP